MRTHRSRHWPTGMAVLAAAGMTAAATVPALASTPELSARIYLAGRDPAGLAAYARAVSQPTSPDYQHYLTPTQVQTRFGATPAQVTAITTWLADSGLRVTATTPHYVAVTGPPAALGTRIPARLAPAVLTITTTPVPLSEDSTPVDVGNCATYYGQKPAIGLPPAYGTTPSYDTCGYTPAQVRAAYGVSGSGRTGHGATVAVVDAAAAPTMAADANTYSTRNGLPTWRAGQYTENLPADIATSCRQTTTYGEESMDVEDVHAMAPDADIVYVGADCANLGDDLLDAETRIVDAHLADIVSDSWHLGTTEDQVPAELIPAYERVFEQGAVEGIGFYFAAGDDGDWSRDDATHQPAVQYPGSDPWVTSVGGTSLAVGPNGTYEWEVPWGDDLAPLSPDGTTWSDPPGVFYFGTGGGPSARFAQPGYQRGIVPDALSEQRGTPARVIPDIAADADLATGLRYGHTTTTAGYEEFRGDGTSQATPLIAGIQADAQQARHGVPIGFANPAIYARYGTPAFHDITDDPPGVPTPIAVVDQERDPGTGATSTGLGTLGQDTSLTATPGYDDTTGVGTPSACYLDSYR